MSKGNSELLSKHQAKIEYTSAGIVGDIKGYEVLKEVTIRVRNHNVRDDHKVILEGRMATDDNYDVIGTVEGDASKVFSIATFDYIRFTCIVYSSYDGVELRSSAFFSDGDFTPTAVNDMSTILQDKLNTLVDNVCKVQDQIEILNRQIEIITDHEEDEVK